MATFKIRKCLDGSMSYYGCATINSKVQCASFKTESEVRAWCEQIESTRASIQCMQCGTQFQSQPAKSIKYCSERCQEAATRLSTLKYKKRIREELRAARKCRRCNAQLTGSSRRYCIETCTRTALHANRDVPERDCMICGKKYKNAKVSVTTCSSECTLTQRDLRKTRHCQTCGSSFIPTNTGARAYCSDACRFIVKVCDWCTNQFKRTLAQDLHSNGAFCSHACRLASAKSTQVPYECLQCGKQGYRQPCQHYKRFCTQSCKRIYQGETSPEQVVRLALDARGIAYKKEAPILRYLIDFLCLNDTLAIEVDGDYWHGREATRKKDMERDAKLLSMGIRTVRILESQLSDLDTFLDNLFQPHLLISITDTPGPVPAAPKTIVPRVP